MKRVFSRALLGALAALSITACAVAPEDALDDATQADTDAVSTAFTTFKFGAQSSGGQGFASNADILEARNWVLDGGIGSATESDLRTIKGSGKIPYVYFYIAGGQAKRAYGIDDCNVASFERSLCRWGGDYISKHADTVVNAHAQAARQLKSIIGDGPALVHIEPDWYQYTLQTFPGYNNQPAVHALSFEESGRILNRIIAAVRDNCSTCRVVLHVSPWAGNLHDFFAPINMDAVSYLGLVGRQLQATTGKVNNYTYAEMSAFGHKKLIVNTGHGAGGAATPYDTSWEGGMLTTMWNAGVAAVIQSNENRSRYEGVIAASKQTAPAATVGGFKFTVSPNINPWWIEVRVDAPAGQQVQRVVAEVGGKSYQLTRRSWGAWAVSPTSAVPGGAVVTFKAYDGASHVGTFRSSPWPAQ